MSYRAHKGGHVRIHTGGSSLPDMVLPVSAPNTHRAVVVTPAQVNTGWRIFLVVVGRVVPSR